MTRPESVQTPPIDSPEVEAVFASYPPGVRAELMALRHLIFDTAERTEGVGPLEEALRWGQPSYLTSQTGSGSTIRIAATPSASLHDYAMYFICRTNLVDTFEELFGDVFTYEPNRALLFAVGDPLPQEEIRACVAMALTYHHSER